MAEPLLTTPQSRVALFLKEAHRDFTVVQFKYSSVFRYEITLAMGHVKMEVHVRPRKDHLGLHAFVYASMTGT